MVAGFAMATESQVVGYQNLTLTPGEQEIASVQFMTVAGEDVNLHDLKPNEDFGYEGTAYIMWWDSTKGFVKAYWTDPDYESFENAKWCDGGDEPLPADFKTFKCGEGFFVYPLGAGDDVTITIAGAIKTTSPVAPRLDFTLTPGEQEFVANPLPVSFALKDLIPTEEFGFEGMAYLMWWDMEKGYVKAFWTDPDYGSFENATWCDSGDNPLPDNFKSFKPGEGFWVYPVDTEAGVALTFPNPFYTPAN